MLKLDFVLISTATLAFWLCVFFHALLVPLYMTEVGFGENRIGLAIGAGALGALLGRLSTGAIIDRFGSRTFLVLGALSWVVTSPLMALTENFAILIVFRLVQGWGLAAFTNAALAQVVGGAPEKRRGTAIAWWGAMNPLGTSLGPVLAVWIMLATDFLVPFIVAGSLALLALLGPLVLLPGSSPTTRPRSERFRLLAPAAVFPGLLASSLGFAFGAFISFAPLIAQRIGLTNPGLYLTVFAVTTLVLRFGVGPIADRYGRAWLILPGLLFTAAGMGLVPYLPHPVWGLSVPVLMGVGAGAVMPGLIAWAVERAPETQRALAGSTLYIFYEIGLFLGASMLGFAIDRFGYMSFVLILPLLLAAALAYAMKSKARAPIGS